MNFTSGFQKSRQLSHETKTNQGARIQVRISGPHRTRTECSRTANKYRLPDTSKSKEANDLRIQDLEEAQEVDTMSTGRSSRPVSGLIGGNGLLTSSRPGTSASLQLESRLPSGPGGKQVPSRPSTCASRRVSPVMTTVQCPTW